MIEYTLIIEPQVARNELNIIVGVRVVNVFVPLYFKAIVDALMQGNIWPYKFILIWGALRLLQGGGSWSMGILNNIR